MAGTARVGGRLRDVVVARRYGRDADVVRGISRVFDAGWYLDRYPDVRAGRMSPLRHFLRYGGVEDRDPSAWFDSAWYRRTYLEGRHDAWPIAVEHYLAHGRSGDVDPHPRFDAAFYLRAYPDVAASGHTPLEHFLRWGRGTRLTHPLDGNPEFDAAWYLATNPDVAAAGLDPLTHYLTAGAAEGRRRHRLDGDPLWDPDWYVARYPDVAGSGCTPWEHYVRWGVAQDRNPSPRFSTAWYRAQYPALEHDPTPLLDFAIRRDPATLARTKAEVRRAAEDDLARHEAGTLPVRVPRSDNAEVTVVVVVRDEPALTLRTLRSLADVVSTRLRTVVVDNGSGEPTRRMLAAVEGIEVLRNDDNAGFGPAVNQGVAVATTDAVLLLNNDATVDDTAVAAALQTLRAQPDAAAVGGRIRHPNGLLQEAGSLVWRDASTEGYLRGMPFQDGRAMHRRDVDYVSGVFTMLRREAFLALGGFDPAFAPAYYEESDWCVRAWHFDARVVYEPRALVDHVEFGTAQAGHARELMTRHREVFAERHRDWLSGRPRPSTPASARHATRATGRPRVLVVDDRIPRDVEGSGYPRAGRIVDLLAEVADVTHLPLRQPVFADWEPVWAERPREVEFLPEVGADGLGAFLAERRGDVDVVMVSRMHNLLDLLDADAAAGSPLRGVRLVYDAEAVHPHDPLARTGAADAVFAVSEADAASLRAAGARDVRVLGHDVPLRPVAADPAGRDGLLFVGNLSVAGSPNVESLRWLADEILPVLRTRLARPVRVRVAGAAGAPELDSLPPEVELLGAVPDLDPLFATARVVIAPTRRAAGVPHKVHEAASRGMPQVVTHLIAEQVGWGEAEGLRIATDADAFADAVADLLTDDDAWLAARERLLATTAAEHAPAAYRATLLDTLGIAADRPGGRPPC